MSAALVTVLDAPSQAFAGAAIPATAIVLQPNVTAIRLRITPSASGVLTLRETDSLGVTHDSTLAGHSGTTVNSGEMMPWEIPIKDTRKIQFLFSINPATVNLLCMGVQET